MAASLRASAGRRHDLRIPSWLVRFLRTVPAGNPPLEEGADLLVGGAVAALNGRTRDHVVIISVTGPALTRPGPVQGDGVQKRAGSFQRELLRPGLVGRVRSKLRDLVRSPDRTPRDRCQNQHRPEPATTDPPFLLPDHGLIPPGEPVLSRCGPIVAWPTCFLNRSVPESRRSPASPPAARSAPISGKSPCPPAQSRPCTESAPATPCRTPRQTGPDPRF